MNTFKMWLRKLFLLQLVLTANTRVLEELNKTRHKIQKRLLTGTKCQEKLHSDLSVMIKCDYTPQGIIENYVPFSGALISPGWVLTSAQAASYCRDNGQCRLKLEIGNILDTIECKKMIPYPKYDDSVYSNNIGLISYTGSSGTFTPPQLPNRDFIDGDSCMVLVVVGTGPDRSGFGSKTLCSKVEHSNRESCIKKHEARQTKHHYKGEPVICSIVEVSIICNGDLGAAVYCGKTLIGIVSHQENQCIDSVDTLITARIDSYYTFIKKHTGIQVPFESEPIEREGTSSTSTAIKNLYLLIVLLYYALLYLRMQ